MEAEGCLRSPCSPHKPSGPGFISFLPREPVGCGVGCVSLPWVCEVSQDHLVQRPKGRASGTKPCLTRNEGRSVRLGLRSLQRGWEPGQGAVRTQSSSCRELQVHGHTAPYCGVHLGRERLGPPRGCSAGSERFSLLSKLGCREATAAPGTLPTSAGKLPHLPCPRKGDLTLNLMGPGEGARGRERGQNILSGGDLARCLLGNRMPGTATRSGPRGIL